MPDQFFATQADIDEAKRRLKARGILPDIGRHAGALLSSVGSGLASGLASIERTGAAIAEKVRDSDMVKGLPVARLMATGVAKVAPHIASGLEAAGEFAGSSADAYKEAARDAGTLHKINVPVPFSDGKRVDLTSMGAAKTAGNVVGAAIPYAAAGALAPEIALESKLAQGVVRAGLGTADKTGKALELGRIGKGLYSSAVASPLVASQARTKEGSTLGAIGEMTGNPSIQAAADNPLLRYGTELGVDLLGNMGGEAIGAVASRFKRVKPEAVAAELPKGLPAGHYEMGPATYQTREHPELDPRKLLAPSSKPVGTDTAGEDLLGPGIPSKSPRPRAQDLFVGGVPPERQLQRGPLVTPAPLSNAEKLRRVNMDEDTRARLGLPPAGSIEAAGTSIPLTSDEPPRLPVQKAAPEKKGRKSLVDELPAPETIFARKAPPPRVTADLSVSAGDPEAGAGREQVTSFSDGSKVKTRYRVIDRAEIAPSHNAGTFRANPDATPGIQGRSYDQDPGAQAAIARGGLEFDPDRALNPASSPEEGPPIVTAGVNAKGKRDVVSGNARVLMLDRAAEQQPHRVQAYRTELAKRAPDFGIDPNAVAGMKDPVLVRELVDPTGELHTPEKLAQLNNLSDRPATKTKSRGDEAATRAGNLAQAPEALAHFASTFDTDHTLAEYLGSSEGKDFFGKLIEGGVIAPEEARGFTNVHGELDDAGRQKLQDVLRASVLEDPRIAERGGAAVRKLDGALPSLALTKSAGPEWSIAPTVKDAVALLQESNAAGMRSVADLAGQGDLLGKAPKPDVLAMAQFIESTGAKELKERFRKFAAAAQESGQRANGASGDLFPESALTPDQLREQLFGITKTDEGPVLPTGGENVQSDLTPPAEAPPSPGSRPSIDHSILSPSGRVSDRARGAALDKAKQDLFGDEGFPEPQPPAQPSEAARLRTQAKELRDLADRGMSPRKYAAKADELDAQAEALEKGDGGISTGKPADVVNDPQTELLHGGPPKEWLQGAGRLVRGNLAGTAGGAAIGAATADEGHRGEGALQGGLVGMLAQAGLRTAMRALEKGSGAAAAAEAKTAPAGGRAGPSSRLVDVPHTVDPGAEDVRPVRPSVTEKREALGVNAKGEPTLSARDYFNIPRLNLPDELQDAVANRVVQNAPGAQGVPKKVVSNAETKAKAATLLELKSPEQLAALNPARMNGPEGVAIASLVRERVERINDLSKKLADATLSTAERAHLTDELVHADGEANQLLRTVMKGASEQGRALQANKILANLRSPEAALVRAQKMLGDRPLTAAEKIDVLAKVNAGDEKGAAEYIANLRKASLPEQLVTLRKAGLLTSLRGRALDLTSGALTLLAEQGINKPVQVATDILLGATMTGERTRFHGNTKLYAEQLGRGARRGLDDAITAMGIPELTRGGIPSSGLDVRKRLTAWATKMREVDISPERLAKMDLPNVTTIDFMPGGKDAKANIFLDTYQKAVFQFTTVADRVVKAAAYRGAMVDAAESIARAEKTPAARMAERVHELIAAPTDEMIAGSVQEAERMTFQNRDFASKFTAAIKHLPDRYIQNPAVKSAARATMDFLFPFVATPANITARVLDYAGVAGVRAVVGYAALRKALSEGASAQEIRALQKEIGTLTGRAATGAVAMYGVGSWLYGKGLLTGAYPATQKERDQWRLEGKQANSMLIDDEWIPVGRLAVLGTVLAAGANVAQAVEGGGQQTWSERAAAAMGGTLRTALDQPFVTGTQALLDATQDPSRFGERLLQSQASSLVPTGVSDVARLMDKGHVRRAEGAVEAVQERLPGAREGLPARIDALGDETKSREGFTDIFLNPMGGVADRSKDPVIGLLKDTGARITAPKRQGPEPDREYKKRQALGDDPRPQFRGESSATFEVRQRFEGKAVRAALEDLMASGELDQITDRDEKIRAIEDAATQARRDVRDQLAAAGLIWRKEE